MPTKAYLKEILLNTVVIFISYLVAVVIRYKILRSEPGIDALSLPYLLVALIYSLLISCTFDKEEYPRWLTHSSAMNSLIKMLSQNAIGCLLLLASFYFVGIVNFSRWALFLFWVVSSFGLILKREVTYSRIARRRGNGQDTRTFLVIGDGKLAEEYFRSIQDNPQFGIDVAGYLGNSDRLSTDVDAIFGVENYPGLIIRWLGEYSEEQLERIIKEKQIERIVIADEGISEEKATQIVQIAQKFNSMQQSSIKVLMSVNAGNLINYQSGIHDFGSTKQVELNEQIRNRTVYPAGMVITIALLLLIMITEKFEMKTMNTMRGFDNYRCIIFALFGFFMYLSLGNIAVRTKVAAKRMALTWVSCMVLIVGYELIFTKSIVQSIRLDMIVMTAVIVICFLISVIADAFDRTSFVLME